jgi:hypothetical protein
VNPDVEECTGFETTSSQRYKYPPTPRRIELDHFGINS